MHPTPSQLGLLALFLALYPPLLLYTPIQLMELPHLGICLMIAGGFYRLIVGTASRRVLVVLAGMIVLACWLRPTYGILWLPYWGWILRRPVPTLVLTALLCGIALWLYQYTAAPYVYTFGLVVSEFFWQLKNRSLGAAISEGLYLYKAHVQRNIMRFAVGDLFEQVMRISVVGITLAAIRRIAQKSADPVTRREMCFYAWYLGVGIIITLLVYNTGEWVDFRFFSAPCLLCVGLLIARGRTCWVVTILLLNIIALPSVLTTYHDWTTSSYHQFSAEQITTWGDHWREVGVAYDADAPSRWCNTVSYSFEFLFEQPDMVISFDPGIGLSLMRFWVNQNPRPTLNARYLLLSDADAAAYPRPDLLTYIENPLPNATLFINHQVDCGASGSDNKPSGSH